MFGVNLFLEDRKLTRMEDNHLIIFGDEQDLVFFHVLAKGNFTLIHCEGMRLDPFILGDNLSSNELFYFPQSQKV